MALLVGALRHWRMAGLAVLVVALGLQTLRGERLQGALKAEHAATLQAKATASAAQHAVRTRDAALYSLADKDKRDAAETAAMMKGTCRAAYDAGYAARRCVAGEPAGVRDLRQLWREGAFPGGAAGLPQQPGG